MDAKMTEGMAPQEEVAAHLPTFDMHKAIAVFRRRLKLFAAVALLVLALVVLITFQMTPQYTATARLMLDVRKQDVVNVNAVLSGLPPDSSVVDSEVEVLRSRALAEKVVNQLHLEQDPEFNPTLRKPGMLASLKTSVLGVFRGAAPRDAVKPDDELYRREIHEAVVDTVLGGLRVNRAGLTYLIDVSYISPDPAKAAKLANAFAEGYLTEQLDAKFEATNQASHWLSSRLGELRAQVEAADTALQQYKIANNLMSAQGATLTEQEISNLDQQRAQARAQQAEAEARLATARSQLARGSTGEDVGEALNSPVVQQLRQQRAVASQKVADLQGRYGERHPEMLKARRELADIDSQIQSEINRVISNLEAQAQVARQRTASVEQSVGQTRGMLAGNNRAAVKLNELQRNADSSRTLYETFLNRFKETNTQQGMEQSDARVISPAKIPNSPTSPNKKLNFALGLVLALGAGVTSVMLAEALDRGISTADELESELDVSCVGSIPSLSSTLPATAALHGLPNPIEYVVEKPLSSFAEALRGLRAAVLFSRLGRPVKVIALTSALPGEGKTTTALCLARTVALSGSSVAVLDCDLRQRGVNRALTREPDVGLIEVLNGAAKLDDALIKDKETGAMILPLSKSTFTPKDLFSSEAMSQLMQQLRERFDVVIMDTAPVLPVADTRILVTHADAVVVLARWRKTPRNAIFNALQMLRATDAYIAGAALTQVDLREQSRTGYGDPGFYYRSYRKYYAS